MRAKHAMCGAPAGRAGLFGAAIGIAVALGSCGRAETALPAPLPDQSNTAAFDGRPVTMFTGVRVFDGVEMHADFDVVIAGEEIVAIGRDIAPPSGATLIDGAGRTLMPGLIDAHTHTWDASSLESALVFGVTTMLDMMTSASTASRLKAEQEGEAGFTRADLFSSGYAATAPGGHGTQFGMPVPTLSTPAEAESFVAERVAEGSDYIKIIHEDGSLYGPGGTPTIGEATIAALTVAAHAHGRLAVVHVATLASARAAVQAEADGLVHIWADSIPAIAFADRMSADSMFVVPTLSVQSSVAGSAGGARLVDDARLVPFLDPDARRNLGTAFPVGPRSRASYDAAARSTALMRERGVRVLAGSDAPNPGTWYGVSVHDELERLVRDAGFTPIEALRAATSAPAAAFGLDDRGRIGLGMRADVVLVDGDPTTDITATRAIAGVWKRGRALDRDAARVRVAERHAAAARSAAAASEIPEDGLLLSDFDDGTSSSSMGRWLISTDQMAGGSSTGAMVVRDGALVVSGVIDAGSAFPWSGVMLLPAPQAMQPIDLSAARGIAFRARGPGSFQVALFTERGGRIPAVHPIETTGEWARFELAWSDFGAHDGADVVGIAILAGAEPGAFEFAIDDVELQGR